MNLLARAERDVLLRALVAFALIVAILVAAVASANAECSRYNADGSCGPVVASVKSKKLAAVQSVHFSGSLVARARQYMGTNPTGWRRVWCGRFMAMIAPDAAARVRNPNMARDWAALPHVSAQVGAIAVLTRGKKGGHVGVVTGFDANGNPIVVSGNHNRVVGESVYPRGRVIAYVMP